MPLTRIGKIDKPALRLMAAKAVLEEAFGEEIAVDIFTTPGGGISATLTPCPDGAEATLRFVLNHRRMTDVQWRGDCWSG